MSAQIPRIEGRDRVGTVRSQGSDSKIALNRSMYRSKTLGVVKGIGEKNKERNDQSQSMPVDARYTESTITINSNRNIWKGQQGKRTSPLLRSSKSSALWVWCHLDSDSQVGCVTCRVGRVRWRERALYM